MRVGPAEVAVDERARAVGLAGLAGDERDAGGDRRVLLLPARDGATEVEVVHVDARRQLLRGVTGRVRRPPVHRVRVLHAADHDHVGGAGGAYRREQLLHPGGAVGNAAARATVQQAGPRRVGVVVAVRIRLVEEIEDDRGVRLEGCGHAAPERRRVIVIGHRCLPRCARLAGSRPVQVENDVERATVEQVDVVDDRLAIVASSVGGLHTVDAEPAVLVERDAHGMRMPGRDGTDGRKVVRTVEDAPTLDARVFGTRAVDSA